MIESALYTTSNQLYNYIEDRVLTLYDDLDFAHNRQHVLNVMERSAVMGKLLDMDNDILLKCRI